IGLQPQDPLEQISQRKQCRVLSVLRTPTFPPGMWFIGYGIFQYLHQTGFANAPFTSQEHDLPMSCLGLLPPFKEEGDFRFSTHQRRESSGLSHLKTTGGTTLTEHVVDVHGLSDAT